MGGGDCLSVDDDASVISDSNASSFSSSIYSHTANSVSTTGVSAGHISHTVTPAIAPTTSSASSMMSMSTPFSFFSRASTQQPSGMAPVNSSTAQQPSVNAAGSKPNMFHSTMKVLHAVKQVASLPVADDLDSKVNKTLIRAMYVVQLISC